MKLYIASLLIILSSCTYEFNIDDVEAKRKPVIFCMPNTLGDTTLIQVSQSMNVNNKGTNSSAKPDITFKLNGVEKEIKYIDKATEKSSTVIPQPFPLDKWDMILKDGSYGREIQFRISFTDNADTKDYYGVRIIRKISYHNYYPNYNLGADYDKLWGIEFNLDEEPLLSKKVGFDEIFDISKLHYQEIYLWDDTMLNGKSYTLHLGTNYSEDSVNEYNSTVNFFKIYLYRFSEEMYKYLKSINDIDNNDLGEYGLAPIRSHYTNIENGIGLLGGCSIYETDWIENLKNEENEE